MPRTDRGCRPEVMHRADRVPWGTSAAPLAYAGAGMFNLPKPALTEGLVPDVLLGAADHVIR